MRTATKRQTWAIFCISGYDVRPCNLSIQKASEIIGKLKNGGYDVSVLPGSILKKKVRTANGKRKRTGLKIETRHFNGETRRRVSFPTGEDLSWGETGCYYNSREGLGSQQWSIIGEYRKFYGSRAVGSGKRNWNRMRKYVIGKIENGTITTKSEFFDAMDEHDVDYWCIN